MGDLPVAPPPPPPQPIQGGDTPPALVVAPASVTLSSRQAQVFTVSPTQPVTWSLLPPNNPDFGAIDAQSGVYTAPGGVIARARTAVVRAAANGNVATAIVNLSPDLFWRNVIGIVFLAAILPIAYLVRHEWPAPCQCDFSPSVTPPVSWVQAGDILPFSVAHCPPTPLVVKWKVASGPGTISEAGVFTAGVLTDKKPADAVIQALDADQKVIGSASVHVTPDLRLIVWPAQAELGMNAEQTFTVNSLPDVKLSWSVDPQGGAGSLSSPGDGKQQKYKAPSPIKSPAIVRIIATVDKEKSGKAAEALAGQSVVALIELTPPKEGSCQSAKDLYWFVFWMGLLGSYIHTALSFAAYAGNRKFLSSWTWWYLIRPFTGGLLAVLVFFLFGGGVFGKSDLSNAYLVATYAGLVGLFSETTVIKLKEIIEMLLKPKDERGDKIAGHDGVAAKPVISSVLAESAAQRKYAVVGSGFVAGARVKVGTHVRETAFVSDSKLTFTLLPADTGTLQITVSNPKPDGTTVDSAAATLTVPAAAAP